MHNTLVETRLKSSGVSQQSTTALLQADEKQFVQQAAAQLENTENQSGEFVQQPAAQLNESIFLQSVIAKISWSHQMVLMDKVPMRVYKDLEMVEQLGTGVMRITAYYGHECFRFSENFTRMVFPAAETTGKNIQNGLGKGLGKKLGKELTAIQIKILHLINRDPKILAREMAENIGLSLTAVENNIRKLREAKILERDGGRKEGYWKIIQ